MIDAHGEGWTARTYNELRKFYDAECTIRMQAKPDRSLGSGPVADAGALRRPAASRPWAKPRIASERRETEPPGQRTDGNFRIERSFRSYELFSGFRGRSQPRRRDRGRAVLGRAHQVHRAFASGFGRGTIRCRGGSPRRAPSRDARHDRG